MSKPQENPFLSLGDVMATHVRDWGADSRDAWMWGIIIGWDEECLEELRRKFRWKDADVDRLRRLRDRFVSAIH